MYVLILRSIGIINMSKIRFSVRGVTVKSVLRGHFWDKEKNVLKR